MRAPASAVPIGAWLDHSMEVALVTTDASGWTYIQTVRGQLLSYYPGQEAFFSTKAPKQHQHGKMNFVGGCPKNKECER